MSHLQTGTWPALKVAWQLLCEMRDDVFPDRILEALRDPGEVLIRIDPPIAYERSPLELSICLQRAGLNSAAAREEIDVDGVLEMASAERAGVCTTISRSTEGVIRMNWP